MDDKLDIKLVLDLHLKWLLGEKEGKRANLRYADLTYADLTYAEAIYRLIQIGPIGSRKDILTVRVSEKGNEPIVSTGCFSGTLAEFAKANKKSHPNDYYGKEYNLAIKMIKAWLALEKES